MPNSFTGILLEASPSEIGVVAVTAVSGGTNIRSAIPSGEQRELNA
jgi:hypothetical protein